MPSLDFVIINLSLHLALAAAGLQEPLDFDHGSPISETAQQERIAIVGAGIGGASAAFNIHQGNRNRAQQKVTIFERNLRVGGRVKSVHLYPPNGPLKMIEEGATQFSPMTGVSRLQCRTLV